MAEQASGRRFFSLDELRFVVTKETTVKQQVILV